MLSYLCLKATLWNWALCKSCSVFYFLLSKNKQETSQGRCVWYGTLVGRRWLLVINNKAALMALLYKRTTIKQQKKNKKNKLNKKLLYEDEFLNCSWKCWVIWRVSQCPGGSSKASVLSSENFSPSIDGLIN